MRISRAQMFMEMARVASKRSTCSRLNVGCVAVRDNKVISIGYNGPPSGEAHCLGNNCLIPPNTKCTRSIHAEINCIKYLSEEDKYRDFSLFITHSPCIDCAIAICGQHVKEVYYETEYRDISPIEVLLKGGISVMKVLPNGFILNKAKNLIEDTP